jgi:molecular chaperone DnaJ
MKQDYYEILGITKSATKQEIKKAYRKMAIKYHPDKNPDNKEAEAKFKLAAEAYEVLGNEEKKAKYDRFGHAAFEGGQGFGGGGMNMDDIFSNFGDIFGDIFGGGGRSGFGGSRQRVIKGSNLRIRLKLTLEEIAHGVSKKVKVKRKIKADGASYTTCSTCNGSGQVVRVVNTMLGRMQTAATCNACGGAGETLSGKPAGADAQGLIISDETVSIEVPAGVRDGVQLKVAGKGNEAPGKNSIAGDLLVVIEEVEHPLLKREGDNLHYDLYISLAEAALGTSKEITTTDGKVKVKLDEGIQSGKVLRLRGKGIPSLERYSSNGDLLVHINVWTPQKLSKEQRQFFEKNLDDKNFVPAPKRSEKSFFEKVRDMFS